MNKLLWRNHRTLGWELDRFRGSDGVERVLLQTAAHREDVCKAHMLLPVSERDVVSQARLQLILAIEEARFLGLDNDALRAAFEQALEVAH